MEYTENFRGEIQKITLVSMPCFYLCPPEGGTELEQKLTINISGQVTYTSKEWSRPVPTAFSEGRWRKATLPKDTVKELLDVMIEPFRNYEIRHYCTDVGSWTMTAYNTDGEEFKFEGCLYSESFEKAEEISYLVRIALELPDLYVFDGQHGFCPTKYTYLSVEFSDGGKTYYYRTEDDTIEIDDYVLVPVGHSDEKIVKVVNVEVFSECDVPMLIERVKSIISKVDEPDNYSNEPTYKTFDNIRYDLYEAHHYCINNKPALQSDSKCGCFNCLEIFDPKKITEYLEDAVGTALCPYCGIDSVIPESSGYPLTKDFLMKMYRRWFDSGLRIALYTPLGFVELLLDGKPICFSHRSIDPDEKRFPDVDATYRIDYNYEADGKEHTLCFRLKDCELGDNPETGELLEAVSFYKDKCKLTLGCIASFGDYEDYNLDYDGSLCDDGMEIYITPNTKSQTFKFGVCWIKNCTDENDYQTRYGADPSIDTN